MSSVADSWSWNISLTTGRSLSMIAATELSGPSSLSVSMVMWKRPGFTQQSRRIGSWAAIDSCTLQRLATSSGSVTLMARMWVLLSSSASSCTSVILLLLESSLKSWSSLSFPESPPPWCWRNQGSCRWGEGWRRGWGRRGRGGQRWRRSLTRPWRWSTTGQCWRRPAPSANQDGSPKKVLEHSGSGL